MDDADPDRNSEERAAAIKALHDKVRSDSAGRNRNEADNFLKAAYGLARMMETPEISAFLEGAGQGRDNQPVPHCSASCSRSICVSVSPQRQQRTAYDKLFTNLRALRGQVFPKDDPPMAIGLRTRYPEWAKRVLLGYGS